ALGKIIHVPGDGAADLCLFPGAQIRGGFARRDSGSQKGNQFHAGEVGQIAGRPADHAGSPAETASAAASRAAVSAAAAAAGADGQPAAGQKGPVPGQPGNGEGQGGTGDYAPQVLAPGGPGRDGGGPPGQPPR